MNDFPKGDMIVYQASNGLARVEVKIENETVWLTQSQIAALFDCSSDNVGLHLKNLYEEGEIEQASTTEEFSVVRKEGARQVSRRLIHYNLDAILSVGYRVNSKNATQFRRWASERLKEYLIKGFTMDDERLKQSGGGGYWYELLNRIRDIRSSEKVLYRQVLDLYATSVDYNPKAEETNRFFKIVQNKLHFAAHGHTAAEIIYQRADSAKPFMGLTTFSGDQPSKNDIFVAKNYLDEKELKVLNNLVSGYFDFAEIQAMNHNPMYMKDYVEHLDKILAASGAKLLEGAGSISHRQAVEKAEQEYGKFQQLTVSPVEREYIDNIRRMEKMVKRTKN